jgi:hypothetical protein
MVFAAAPTVNVAIISPALLYGLSPSIEHPLPLTLPNIMNAIKSISSGFSISVGKNLSACIHVMDLARLYLLLVAHAFHPQTSDSTEEIWGPKAYYFGTGEELSFLEFMTATVLILKERGILETNEIKQVGMSRMPPKQAVHRSEFLRLILGLCILLSCLASI